MLAADAHCMHSIFLHISALPSLPPSQLQPRRDPPFAMKVRVRFEFAAGGRDLNPEEKLFFCIAKKFKSILNIHKNLTHI